MMNSLKKLHVQSYINQMNKQVHVVDKAHRIDFDAIASVQFGGIGHSTKRGF